MSRCYLPLAGNHTSYDLKKSEKKKNSSNFLRKVFIIEAEIAIVGKIKQYYWQGENDTGITEYVIRVDFMVRSV